MPDSLGGRLARAGLVTRADLAEIVASAPAHDGALVRALVRRGLPEDALAGFFLSEGFGPLLDAHELDRAEAAWARRVPISMALDFLALPIREATDGVVVAMAAPSDGHIVSELARVLGARVLATVARPSQIEARLRALLPDARLAPSPQPAPEAPVLELTQRRPRTSTTFDTGFRAPDRTKDGKLGPRLSLSTDEVAMPLVRHKPSSLPRATETPATLPPRNVAQPVLPTPKSALASSDWRRGSDRRSTTAELIPAQVGPPREKRASAISAANLELALHGAVERASEPPKPKSVAPLQAEERWDLPSTPPAPIASLAKEPANKLSSRGSVDLPTVKASPGDIGTILSSMRGASDRDEVVRLACEGATSVARAAVFFALRKGVLKGWDGAGPGVRRDSVRNLWIPTSSASTFKKVLETKAGIVGPYGTTVADGLFRAAVGSRGGDFMVQPVSVAGKIVGMLCVDDLRPGPLGAHRVEVLAQAIGDGFVRVISAAKE